MIQLNYNLPRSHSKLEYPSSGVPSARHARPVVIVHGTMVEKDSIQAYRDYALKTGHPVDFRTYSSVKDGALIEESAQQVSQNINQARRELALANLDQLRDATPQELKNFFQVDDSPRAAQVTAQLPWLLDQVDSVAKSPTDKLSFQLKQVETDLAKRLGSSSWTAKAAANLVDCLAPKATLVGHSAGGFVAYAVAVNPQTTGQADARTYDGGLGVGEVVVLSSPIGKGMSFPVPPGLADMAFYQLDSKVLTPLEATPAMQLASLNPFFNLSYAMSKAATKTAYALATQLSTGMSVPLIYATKPGYEEVTGFSNFFHQCIQGKPVPDGVTVVAVTSKDDKMSLPERSRVDDSQPNAHNFDVDQKISAAELQRERPTWGHVQMSTNPEEFQKQFDQLMLDRPEEARRYLDPANNDGSRCEVLQVLLQRCQSQPDFLSPALKQGVMAVAQENQPFHDSPSALAQQILDLTQ